MKSKTKKAAFKFAPFSPKQLIALSWWTETSRYKDKDGIICDGSIRSGKTTIMSLSFVIWAMESFEEENFALCGKTIQSLRRNVIKQLKKILKGRGYQVEEKRSENMMIIRNGEIENYFYLFGGKDEASQDLIQGITLAGLFLDEVALMPESFVNQATGRCSVEGSKMWFNCNPSDPTHYFKTQWIDRKTELNLIRIHFTMDDNPSLSERIKNRYKTMYKGVFFDRFIQGLWVVAEGLVFKYFAEDETSYLIDDKDIWDEGGYLRINFSKKVMGIDFGGNGSKTTFYLTGFYNGYKNLIVLEEDDLTSTDNIDADMICNKFIEFYKMCIAKYGHIDLIQPDSASSTLIYSFISRAKANKLPSNNIAGVKKNEISERPVLIDLLLNSGRLKIRHNCKNLRRALANLKWDAKDSSIPEDKNEGNINDYYDAFCYTLLAYAPYIELER